jgi:hypothetical protein
MNIPELVKVRQTFAADRLEDIEKAVGSEIARVGLAIRRATGLRSRPAAAASPIWPGSCARWWRS